MSGAPTLNQCKHTHSLPTLQLSIILTRLQIRWDRGLGKINSVSLITIYFRNITQAVLLANLPQTILSFLYLTYNSLFTCMLSGHEWSLFGHHHRTLRVTSPRPGQRSTYWLQIPYTYAIPLMTLSGLLHWLTSQSIFLAVIEISDPRILQASNQFAFKLLGHYISQIEAGDEFSRDFYRIP